MTPRLIRDGDPNHSISGDAYRYQRERLRRVIDWLFSPWEVAHCRKAHENDVAKAKRLLEAQGYVISDLFRGAA